MTVQLTPCLTCLDSNKQVNLLIFSQNQTSKVVASVKVDRIGILAIRNSVNTGSTNFLCV